MLVESPQKQFEELANQIAGQVEKTFPIRDRLNRMEVRVKNVQVPQEQLNVHDIDGQAKARLHGSTWAANLTGTVEVVDLQSGKVVATKEGYPLAKIPKMTQHYSYIVGGQEKFIANQWRLRPGPYVRETQKQGDYSAQFQLSKGPAFHLKRDVGGELYFRFKGRKIPAYPVLSAAGVSDDELKKAWGQDIYQATKAKAGKAPEKHARTFVETWYDGKVPGAVSQLSVNQAVRAALQDSALDPEIARANLGVETGQLSGTLLLEASKKLIGVSSGKIKPDAIDSLRYKELWTASDQFSDRLAKSVNGIVTRVQKGLAKGKVQERLRKGDTSVLRDVVMPDLIQRPVYHVFNTSLASNGSQTNPIAMLGDRSMVTITGPGGLANRHSIQSSNQAVDASHLGFLDPVFTPESDPGVTTHLATGVRVEGRRPLVRLYNLKTGKLEDVDAVRASTSNVVLPDQVQWKDGKFVPRKPRVRLSNREGEMVDVEWSQADYVLPSAAQAFAPETNLVPFMQNDSAGRTSMSARHMSQAISIVGREAPKVQVQAGRNTTFEKLIGSTFLAHKAPVDGTVVGIEDVRDEKSNSISSRKIVIKDAAGKTHAVPIYHHYPTNHDKGELHSTPTVKVGDKVKAGQIVADHNFSKGGELAIGTNLRVAYLSNGFNHEDGITISQSAANKLTTEHLKKPSFLIGPETVVSKGTYLSRKGSVYRPEQLKKIGDDGLIQVGQTVNPGDPLVLATTKDTRVSGVADVMSRRMSKRVRDEHKDDSMTWDHPHPGKVLRVLRQGKNLVVHVQTLQPVDVGSKISTRHSAKGIITAILPDEEMPHDEKGKHVEMLIAPVAVPGRQNAGQILETAAGKIADKTGKPYVVKNFDGGKDYLQQVREDLKKHGIKETETLFDPKTGRKLGEIMVGPHYTFQLEHQIDKKTSARSSGPSFTGTGMPTLHYDDNKIPRGGIPTGGQSLGGLGVYGALAAGLKSELRDSQTIKSDQDMALETWGQIQAGMIPPAPDVPFAFKKFEALMTGLGVDMKKDGTKFRLIPRTDEETRKLSHGEITRPTMTVHGQKLDAPYKGGLFDPQKTGFGQPDGGSRWSHIELVEPLPNPVYAKAIAATLGLNMQKPESTIGDIIEGKVKLQNGKTGAAGLRETLEKIDLDRELEETKRQLEDPKIKGSDLNRISLKYKALKSLKDAGKKPADVWTIQAVPVLPPMFRPQSTLKDGTVKTNPLNQLYRRIGSVNEAIRSTEKKQKKLLGYEMKALDSRRALYEELRGLFGTSPKGQKKAGINFSGTQESPNEKLPGIMHMLSGDQPKDGFFQKKMVGKKQDFTARATIAVDPTLSADEIGVPKKIALEMMRPMVASKMTPIYRDPFVVQQMISQEHPHAVKILEKELENRPVIMKRDPVLHQHSLIGQRVKLIDKPAITVNPLVLPPLGGDLDGDTVALFVPITPESVEETKRIMPSQKMFHESTGDVLFSPTNESALALYRTSLPRNDLSKAYTFKTQQEAEAAFKANKISLGDAITVQGVGKTTLGRLRLGQIVPEKYKKDILTKLDQPIDRKVQGKILHDVAKNDPKSFIQLADRMTQLGFQMAYESGHTITLKDLEPLRKERNQLIKDTQKEVDKLEAKGDRQGVTDKWLSATRQLHEIYAKHHKRNPTNISDMAPAPIGSGIKAKREQFQGLVMAPMLVEDHYGNPSRVPVTTSFAEGVDLGGYFIQAAGARRGTIQKTDSVSEPGYLNKLLTQNTIDQPITGKDCGTAQGVSLSIKDKDVVDRYLAQAVTVGGKTYPAGTVVTPEMVAAVGAGKDKRDVLFVRSPLKCRQPQGVCSRCMGVHPSGKDWEVGEAAGLVSSQAMGERAAQLMLKQTHGGGIVSTAGQPVNVFTDVVQKMFLAAPKALDDALLAPGNSQIESVKKLVDGRYEIKFRGKKAMFTTQKPLAHVTPGYTPKKGEKLTGGLANVRDVLKTQGLDAMQGYMAKEIGDVYAKEGVLRRHAELTVRSATGLVRITDPGDYHGMVRGDYVMKPVVDELNRTVLRGKRPIKFEAEVKSVKEVPNYRQPDWMARLQGEQLGKSLRTAIQTGQATDLAGLHPIPALAHGPTFGTVSPPVLNLPPDDNYDPKKDPKALPGHKPVQQAAVSGGMFRSLFSTGFGRRRG